MASQTKASSIQPLEMKREEEIREKNLESRDIETGVDTKENQSAPINAIPALQQWNKPRINSYRYGAALLGMLIMGMNDAAYGVSE